MKNAVIITDNGVEDAEFIYPYYRLLEEEFLVDVAIKDKREVKGKHGYPLKPTIDTKSLEVEKYDLLVIPGGYEAPSRVRQQKEVLDFVREMDERSKLIAAICHGPWVLISAGILKGRRATSYSDCKDDLVNSGALYQDQPVVVDGNIVTAQHYKDLGPWMKNVFETYQRMIEKQ